MIFRRLLRATGGAASIEAAFTIPLVATFMVGVLQFGMIFHANGAMRNAIGDGIRYAKVHPSASETTVLNETRAGLAGISPDGIKVLTFQRGTSNGATFGRITMSYELDPVIPFAAMPPIVLNETRTAYLPA